MIIDKSKFFKYKTERNRAKRVVSNFYNKIKNYDIIDLFIKSQFDHLRKDEKEFLAEYIEYVRNNQYTIHMIILSDCYRLIKSRKAIIDYMVSKKWDLSQKMFYFDRNNYMKSCDLIFYKMVKSYYELEDLIRHNLAN